jgi:hypothetical protein
MSIAFRQLPGQYEASGDGVTVLVLEPGAKSDPVEP